MNRISRKNLEFFYEEMHQVELNKIKDYDFTKNYDILKELVGNGIYNESDFQTYVYNGNIYVGIDLEDTLDLDSYNYLIGAYEVLYSSSATHYDFDEKLTNRWRIIMSKAYPNTTYPETAKRLIKEERDKKITHICKEADKNLDNI